MPAGALPERTQRCPSATEARENSNVLVALKAPIRHLRKVRRETRPQDEDESTHRDLGIVSSFGMGHIRRARPKCFDVSAFRCAGPKAALPVRPDSDIPFPPVQMSKFGSLPDVTPIPSDLLVRSRSNAFPMGNLRGIAGVLQDVNTGQRARAPNASGAPQGLRGNYQPSLSTETVNSRLMALHRGQIFSQMRG
jgi:hypothetical protein